MMSPIGPVRDCSRVPRPGATDDGARAAQARPGVGSLSSDVTGSVRARRARPRPRQNGIVPVAGGFVHVAVHIF